MQDSNGKPFAFGTTEQIFDRSPSIIFSAFSSRQLSTKSTVARKVILIIFVDTDAGGSN